MQTTQEIIAALHEQRSGTTTKITELDKMVSEYLAAKKAERATLLAGVAPIDRALFALGVKVAGVTTSTVRKPMSQEAKDRIRAGLVAASARKRAGVASPAVQQELQVPVAVASAPAPRPTAPAKTAAKKAGGRG